MDREYRPSRKWQVIPAAFLTALIAFIGLRAAPVLAHHNDYNFQVDCDLNWSASAYYTGGQDSRLIVLFDVRTNGADFSPS